MRFGIVVASWSLAGVAAAQVMSSVSTFSVIGEQASVIAEEVSGSMSVEAAELKVRAKGTVTMRPLLEGPGALRRTMVTRGHFKTGMLPIRITSISNAHTTSHSIGGGSANNPISRTFFATRLYAFTDTNSNGKWEEDEARSATILSVGTGVSGLVITQTGTGTVSEVSDGATLTLANFTLATGADYFFETQVETTLSTSVAIATPPLPTFTHIFDQRGYEAQVKYSVVPEPASLWALSVGGFWLARRRKRASSSR